MSQRNSIGRSLAVRFDTLSASGRWIAACGIALVAVGALCLMEEPTRTANYAVAVAFGGLLLVGGVVAQRGSNEPRGAPGAVKAAASSSAATSLIVNTVDPSSSFLTRG